MVSLRQGSATCGSGAACGSLAPPGGSWSLFKNVWKWMGGYFFFYVVLIWFLEVGGQTFLMFSNAVKICIIIIKDKKISTFLSTKICVIACDTRSSVAPCQAVGCCKQTGGCVMGHGSQREKEKGSWWEQGIQGRMERIICFHRQCGRIASMFDL